MSAFSGPKIINQSLVFSYDAENTSKSWKGSPTTNLVNPSWASWSIDGSGQGNIGTRTINSTYECTIVDSNANTRQNIYITSGITASTTYTFSVQYQKIYGTPTLRFQIQAYNSSTYLSLMSFATTAELGITDIDGWQTAKITLTTPANCNRILWFMQDGDDYTAYTHSFSLKNVQCEQNSFATPFVNGTRSNTQAILDLTGNHTITINDLTYNSDNTFTFDGSNDYLSLPGISSQFTTDVTVEAVIKPTANPSDWVRIVGTGGNSGNRTFGLWYSVDRRLLWQRYGAADPTIYPTSPVLTLNSWNHIMATCSGTAHTLYLNGEIIGTATAAGPWAASSENLTVGFAGFHTYPTGQVPLVRLYTSGLTTAEVQQNFRAIRGRFGI